MDEALSYVALAVAGAVAAAINVVAGGGSFLTLPVLIWMGLPPTVANATNRVGILAQSLWGAHAFDQRGVLDRRWASATAPAAVLGAVLGTGLALLVEDPDFRRLLAMLMVVLTLLTLVVPWQPRETPAPPTSLLVSGGFFVVGIYGGFVQAGVGFLILSVTTLAGVDLVRGNALKFACILVFTPLSLAIFVWQGMVEWGPGLCLAVGSMVGSEFGVRMTILKGHRWLRVVVNLAVIVFAVLLWVG